MFPTLAFVEPDICPLCLDKMAAGGGYMLAPAKPILPGAPVDNAVALIDRFVNQV